MLEKLKKIFRQSIDSEAGVIENAFGGVEVNKVVEKEPLEKRSEALEEENPKSSPKFSSKSDVRGPKSTTKSIIRGRILLLNRSLSNGLKFQGV